MSKFVAVIFPTEAKAYEGQQALDALHGEGSITVYASTVVTRNASGTVSIHEADDPPIHTAVGALAGALSGLFAGAAGLVAGPAGLAAGTALGTMMGGYSDLYSLGLNQDFVRAVTDSMTPGTTALLADVDEEWETPLDTRMHGLGGTVHRQWRRDFEDAVWEREVASAAAEWEALEAEHDQAVGETKAKLRAKADAAKAKLDATKEQADARRKARKAEHEAKMDHLEEQVRSAPDGIRAKIEARKARQAAEHAKREEVWDQLARDMASQGNRA
jgi:uncharacterized membrane protein